MVKALSEYKPTLLWKHFEELTKIPRESKHEAAAIAYVVEVAERNGLKWNRDETGNVVVRKPGSRAKKGAPTVVLQGHVDMVCEKNADVKFDFAKDPIRTVVRKEKGGKFLYADGTTLGADNGIGVAAALALMDENSLAHPPLELLFTVDEETGLTGAMNLQPNFLKGKILINLDTEEDDTFYIGCAGGGDTHGNLTLTSEPAPKGAACFSLTVKGLRGGHSGTDINLQRGNAVQILARLLHAASRKADFALGDLRGGNKHNAIPREAEALVYLKKDQEAPFAESVQALAEVIAAEIRPVDPKLQVKVEGAKKPSGGKVLAPRSRERVLGLLMALPHGVLGWSHEIHGLVETSTNLAAVRTEGRTFHVLMSTRSSTGSLLDHARYRLNAIFGAFGANIVEFDAYPGWKPDPESKVLQVAKRAYKRLYKESPKVTAVHAGLECGIIGARYPGMDMVSIGPLIQNPHSPDERVEITTVNKFWKVLAEILKDLAKGK